PLFPVRSDDDLVIPLAIRVVLPFYLNDFSAGFFDVTWSDNRSGLPSCAPLKDPNCYYQSISLGNGTPTPTPTSTPMATPTATSTPTATPRPSPTSRPVPTPRARPTPAPRPCP